MPLGTSGGGCGCGCGCSKRVTVDPVRTVFWQLREVSLRVLFCGLESHPQQGVVQHTQGRDCDVGDAQNVRAHG